MDTTLLVNISGTYERLDLFEDIPITLTLQQSDVTNLVGRKVPFSKTIQIPDTQANAILLEHFFEVNGTDFNPLSKVPCVVQYRGTDIFQGLLRMNSVSTSLTNRIWEIYILGEVADFTTNIKDFLLQDLDWTDLQHEHNYDNITLSWQAKNNDIDGLFGGEVIYPLINYGLDYQNLDVPSAATPSFTYSFGEARSFDQAGFPVPEKMFKPALRVKNVLDRIFARTGYQVDSEFFDTDYFKSIYMDTFTNGKIGIEQVSGVTNQNIFKAGMTQRNFRYTGNRLVDLPLFDFLPGTYDPLNNYQNPSQSFRVPYAGDYYFNIRFNVEKLDPTMLGAKLQVVAFVSNDENNISGGTQVFQSTEFNIPVFAANQPQNIFFSATCTTGQYLKVYLRETDNPTFVGTASNQRQYLIKPYNYAGIVDPYVSYDLYNGPILTGVEDVDFSLGVPNLNCLEFLKSLVQMFNLIIYQDEANQTIRIEPYNWYYNNSEREVKDWTNKLDLTTYQKVEPLSFDLKKEVVWTTKENGFEFLSRQYRERFDHEFGRMRFTSPDNIFVGEESYVSPFASIPTSGVTGNVNFIIPQCYYFNNGLQTPYSTTPHLFFWVGNRYVDPFGITNPVFPSTSGRTWYMLSGATPVAQTTYPCVSHQSLLDTTLPSLMSDLNYLSDFDFFGNSNTQVAQFSPYDLYSSFWETYITNLYSRETRRLAANFWFKPLDVYETSLSDKIFIKDANYTIEKIQDANLVNKQLTNISLIKDVYPYYKILPPNPVYLLDPNEPYPGIEPAFTTLCYVSFDKEEVCNTTAPIVQITTFGTGTLQNFRKVYEDTGTQLLLLTAGTYLRQTTGSQLFVVADIYGRIIEQDC